MLGSVVQQQMSPEKARISSKLQDAIMESWHGNSDVNVPTLVEKDKIWEEFWLYASGTHKWCPRMSAIQALSNPDGEKFNAETMWNFEQGHSYHDLFQQKILPSLGSTRFLGSWQRYVKGDSCDSSGPSMFELECAGKESMHGMEPDDNVFVEWGMSERPPLPEGEERNPWRYKEVKIRLLNERIVVKLDGVLVWDDFIEVFELKTEKESARDSLDPRVGGKARPYHVEQVMLAMHATGIRRARIVYLFKGGMSLSGSMLEHEIFYDEEIAKELLARAKSCKEAVRRCDEFKLEEAEKSIEAEKCDDYVYDAVIDHFPRLAECPMKSKGKAQKCSCRDICFPNGYLKKEKKK